MEALNNSLSSLVDENLFGGEMETEELLLRRLSPYATLRPGDFSVLFGISQPQSGDHSNRKLASSLFLDNAIAERGESDDESSEEPEFEGRDIEVRGQDIGDLPAVYVVRGLRRHEMPVIGNYSFSLLPPFLLILQRFSIIHERTRRGTVPAQPWNRSLSFNMKRYIYLES